MGGESGEGQGQAGGPPHPPLPQCAPHSLICSGTKGTKLLLLPQGWTAVTLSI